ncbi:hypothetical protein M427DRAFT_32685 [Gonapodya prolifera JEL478]|uniref:Uncharacterized protein n=1 Tax=Gonapodya prolifera (strain JEL478) TaxID=1344416 RepID=A0A139AE59_GONPJ|nr:hypothetical protein M427DRAFT_32685 [Gonapodya prolifera JEL478]|eukprot:KXS14959.1 hypothetical protein M427DRAFT_32685 [Gonapodya prolifera JEL478]
MLAHSQTRILLTKRTALKSRSLPFPSFRRLRYTTSPHVKPQTVATGRPGGDSATKTAPAEQKDKRPWVSWVGIFLGLATAGFATGYATADTSSKSSEAGVGITPLGKDVDRGVNGGGAVKSLKAALSLEGARDGGGPPTVRR